jgi:hypothetical protein
MADLNTRFALDTLRSLAFGSIVAGYTAIGDALDFPAIQVTIQNLTDVILLFSLDGVINNHVLPTNGYWVIDITANQQATRAVRLPAGTMFYVKRLGIPTIGSVYVTVGYAK